MDLISTINVASESFQLEANEVFDALQYLVLTEEAR